MTTRPRYISPKRVQSPPAKRSVQLSNLLSQVLPQLLENRLGTRLDLLEQSDPQLRAEILNVRQEVNELIDKSSFMSPDVQELYIKHDPLNAPIYNRSESPPKAMRTLNLEALLTMTEMHGYNRRDSQEGSVIRLSPVKRNESQISSNESPRGSFFDQFSPMQTDVRRNNPHSFVLKAAEGIKQITKKELMELKSLMNPSHSVASAMEALCLLFNEKPRWANARTLIASGSLISRIVDYDLNSVSQATMEKIDLYVKSPLIDYERLKARSPVAAAFWKWIRSVHYYFIANMRTQQTEGPQMTGYPTEYRTEYREETKQAADKGPGGVSEDEEEAEEETSYFTRIERLLEMLDEAAAKVKGIKKKDLTELFAMKYPPSGIKKTLEALCMIFGEKPTWLHAKKLILENNLLQGVDGIKFEAIPEEIKQRLHEMIHEPDMNEELVQKQSLCAGTLNRWVHAVVALFPQEELEDLGVKHEGDNRPLESQYKIRAPSIETINEVTELTIKEDKEDKEEGEKKDRDRIELPEEWPEDYPGVKEALEEFVGLKKSDFTILKRNKNLHAVKGVLEGLYIAFKAPASGKVDFKFVSILEYDKLIADIEQLIGNMFRYDYENLQVNVQKRLKDHIRQQKMTIEGARRESPGIGAIWHWLNAVAKCNDGKVTAGDYNSSRQKGVNILGTLETEEIRETGQFTPVKQLTRTKKPSLSSSRKSFGSLSHHASAHKETRGTEDTTLSSRKVSVEFDNEELSSALKDLNLDINDVVDLKRMLKVPKPVESILKIVHILCAGFKGQLKDAQKLLPMDSIGLQKLLNINPDKIGSTTIKFAKMEVRESKIAEEQFDAGTIGHSLYKWARTVMDIYDQHRAEMIKTHREKEEEQGHETPRKGPLSARMGSRAGSMGDILNVSTPSHDIKKVDGKEGSHKEKITVSAKKSVEMNSEAKKRQEYKAKPRIKSHDFSSHSSVKILKEEGAAGKEKEEVSEKEKDLSHFKVQDLLKKSPSRTGAGQKGINMRRSMELDLNKLSETERSHRKSTEKLSNKEVKVPVTDRKRPVQAPQASKSASKSGISGVQKQSEPVKGTTKISHQRGKSMSSLQTKPVSEAVSVDLKEDEDVKVINDEPVVNKEEEEVKSEVVDHKENKEEDNAEVINKIKEVIEGDVEGKVEAKGLDKYIQRKIESSKEKIKALQAQNEALREGGVVENPQEKGYAMKPSTVSVVEMVESDWIPDLLKMEEWDDKILHVLIPFEMIYGGKSIQEVCGEKEIRAYIVNLLEKLKDNIVPSLLGIKEQLDLDMKTKIKLQKYLGDKGEVLNPVIYEDSDKFCGVVSFLLKEVCEYLGVIPLEMTKKASAKERIYLYNLEKIRYYENRLEKLNEIVKQHNLPVIC